MIIRKKINIYEYLIYEKIGGYYLNETSNKKINKLLSDIYEQLKANIIKRQLEDGKEIISQKFIKEYIYKNGKKQEMEIDLVIENLADYFRNHQGCFEYRFNYDLVNKLEKLEKEVLNYEREMDCDFDIVEQNIYLELELED